MSATLAQGLARVRAQSLALAEGLSAEDCQLQSMPDASPVKWHLAHTTWFFETFVLQPHRAGYRVFDPAFRALFNSYYVGIGARAPRAERGLMSRPSLDEVRAYRAAVDAALQAMLGEAALPAEVRPLIALGIEHEQQHQELILTDLKHHLSRNPLQPVYRPRAADAAAVAGPMEFLAFEGGVVGIGHGGPGFAFDNETPRHRVFLEPYALGARLVTNAEYAAFIADGGYRRPELWLSDGWDCVQREGWTAPLYWLEDGTAFTLNGAQARAPQVPVCHVSYYEAEAYARWAGARLPTEFEWEHAAAGAVADGSFVESGRCHPAPADASAGARLQQCHGELWQWTASAYLPYPGYRPAAGAVGEYNGKFMINQMVLRGSSCATPRAHARDSYRNFFPPAARWQFSGIRLARG